MNNEALEIVDNEFLRQFETTINGEKALIEYTAQDRKIFLTKVVVGKETKENGLEAHLIAAVLAIVKERNINVVPTSPLVAKFMRKHRRQYRALLPAGIAL